MDVPKCEYIFLKGASKDQQCPLNGKVQIDNRWFCNKHSRGKKLPNDKQEIVPKQSTPKISLQPQKQFIIKPPEESDNDDIPTIVLPNPGEEEDRQSVITEPEPETDLPPSDVASVSGSVKSQGSTISVERPSATKLIEQYYTKFPILSKVLPFESIEHLSPEEHLEKLKLCQSQIGTDYIVYSGFNCITLLTQAMLEIPGYSASLNPFNNGMTKELLDEISIQYLQDTVLGPESRLLLIMGSTAMQLKCGVQIQQPVDGNTETKNYKPEFQE